MKGLFKNSFILLTTAFLVVSGFFVFAQTASAEESRTVTSVTLNGMLMSGSNSITVAGGATVSASITVDITNSSNWNSTGWRISTMPDTYTCVNHSDINSNGSHTQTFDITAPPSSDTYNVYFFASSNDTCNGGSTGAFTHDNGVIVDATPPEIASHENLTVPADSLGSVTVNYTSSATTDNVDAPGVANCTPASGTVFTIAGSPYTVTCNATDNAGNPAIPITFTVTVDAGPVDAIHSTIICSPDKQITGGIATCNITVKDQFNNPIQGVQVNLSSSDPNNTFGNNGGTTNSNGNVTITFSSTTVGTKIITATAGITTLTTTPTIEFYVSTPTTADITASPNPQEASLAGADVGLTIYITDQYGNTVKDGITVSVSGIANTSGTVTIPAGGTTENGQITRVLTFDNKGDVTLKVNISSIGNLNLTGDSVIYFVDTTAPIVNQHENISGVEATSYSGATVGYTNPTATDNIDGSVSVDCVPAAGSTFALGNTTVTCSATDSSLNTGTSTFTVEVVDTTPPTITAPADITMEATAPLTIVDLGLPTVLDIADSSPVVTNDAPAGGFPVGTTTVTWTVTDASGNSATDTQTVIITDTTAPVITAPIDQTFEATGPLTTLVIPPLVPAAAIDVADPSPVITYQPQEFPLGTTIVTWTATDASGNSATATSNITIEDTTPPTIAPYDNIIAEATSAAGAVVNYENPTATDLVDGETEVSCAPESGSVFPLGDTIITCNSSDNQGNNAVPTTFTITVQDTTGPEIASHEDVTAEGTSPSGAIVTYTDPTATDLVDGPTSVTCDPASGSQFILGDTTVTCISTDSHSNSSTSTFLVHVVDTTAPIIIAPVDISQEDNGFMSTVADLGLPTVSDIADSNPTITNNAPLTFPLGTTIVIWTATDDWGNSATDTQNVIIYAGPITHIVLTASPTELAFIDSSLITVAGYDQYENVVTNNDSTIIVLSADGGGSLANTILTLSSGVATTNLSKDSAGIVHITASSDGLTPQSVTVTFTETDTSSPYVESHTPVNGATNVALNVHPALVFDEPLDTTTVSSANIQLKKYSDDSVVPASVSPAEGDRQVIITPINPLDFNTQYYFEVSAGATDKVGNPAIPYGKADEGNIFTTIPDSTILSVTGISAVKTYAVADGTYENGWSWIFNVTVPTAETDLQMKFDDWTSSLNTILVANNIRYSSVQASNGPVEITAANTYGDSLYLTGDLNSSAPGRQIEILVEAKIPAGSEGGSYSTSYGIESISPLP